MKTAFRKSFARDIKKINDRSLLRRIESVIEDVEAADDLSSIANLKKITGTANFYRIRIGEYRIGIAVDHETVDFVRCMHRRDLYRFFP